MKIIVIGAGVIGVTTAYLLSSQGHKVTILDKNKTVACEGSRANGGQLSYGFASPLGSPALLRKMPSILAGQDPAFKIGNYTDKDFLTWSIEFIRNCFPNAARQNDLKLSQLASESRDVLREIKEQCDFDFSHRNSGKLIVYGKESEFQRAAQTVNSGLAQDKGIRALSRAEVLKVEPALHQKSEAIAGGLYIQSDDVGDAAQFTSGLSRVCVERYGVDLFLGQNIKRLIKAGRRIAAIETEDGCVIEADLFVGCLGAGNASIFGKNTCKNIYPIKGYSITAPAGKAAPGVAITDVDRRIVYSRIGRNVRVAGFADFGRGNPAQDQRRIDDLTELAKISMPEMANYNSILDTWVGLRPATPTSLPVIGKSGYSNLLINMGHGMFGWTLAAGSARIISDMVGPEADSHKWRDAA